MATPIVLEDVIIAEPVDTRFEDAARFLEQAFQVSGHDPQIAYLLALARKRQGKPAEARAALRKIPRPDANVWLQLGLLSLQEKQYAQAEEELAKAWGLDPASYEVGSNLLLTRLTLGQVEPAAALATRLLDLAPPAEQRFLQLLGHLLASTSAPTNNAGAPPIMVLEMTPAEEQRLVQLLRGVEPFETSYALLHTLAVARPNSLLVREAVYEAAVVQGKRLADRCEWGATLRLLEPLVRGQAENRNVARPVQVACLNLVGCAACMDQNFDRAVHFFSSALRLASTDARLYQNLALAHEFLNQSEQAAPHWNRFLELLDNRVPGAPDFPDYLGRLAFETLNHLGETYARRERWPEALRFLQQALHLRPDDGDLLERLFHLYTQLKRPEDARRTLYRLRQLRPQDPQLDLYELDLHETKTLDDIDRMLNDIARILKKYPNDMRVEERALGMVGNVIPLMGRLCDQFTEQMGRIIDQVRRLPSYQVNWSAVREVMRDLEDEFLKLRQITRQCLPLVTTDEHRRIIRELSAHIDRKIEDCRRLSRA